MTVIFAVVILYLGMVFSVGLIAGRRGKVRDSESYFVGKRNFGALATGLSSGATSSSGWIFLGCAGYAYTSGLVSLWMYVGFAVSLTISWFFFGPRLRKQSGELKALDAVDYFSKRLEHTHKGTKSNSIKIVASIITIMFYFPYMASQLVSAGKTLTSLLPVNYTAALVFSGVFVIAYCMIGGYTSVIYTDMVQGLFMTFILCVFPIFMLFYMGGWSSIWTQLIAIDPLLASPAYDAGGALAFGVVAGYIFYGLADWGQPQGLQRFITAKPGKSFRRASYIRLVWSYLTMCGSAFLGMCGRILMPNLADPEFVVPTMVQSILPSVLTGLVIAAIFAAIQSTYSSQIMTAVQAISSNLLGAVSKREYTEEQKTTIGRVTMVCLGILSILVAVANIDSIFNMVIYAWSGLGSAFGPLLVLLLFVPQKVNNQGAIAGMLAGGVVASIWYVSPYSTYIQECLPGMIASFIVILAVSKMTMGQTTAEVKAAAKAAESNA